MNNDGTSDISSQAQNVGIILFLVLIVLLVVFRNHGKVGTKIQFKTVDFQNSKDGSEEKEIPFDNTNGDLLAEISQLGTKKQSTSAVLTMLAVSALLFVLLGAYRWSLEFILLLAVAIFVHECGHLLAMKIYGYKNLKMIFIPFFGGVASGEPNEHDSFKMAVISLAGPLVGLLAGMFSFILGVVVSNVTPFARFAVISFVLNVFNLLPFVPLDGGNFLNETFFARFPKAELGFKILAVCGLAYLALHQAGVLLGVIAFAMAVFLPLSYKMSAMIVRLRTEAGFREGPLNEEKISRIRFELRQVNPHYESKRNIRGLPGVVKNIWNKVQKKFPSRKATAFLIGFYLVLTLGLIGFAVAFVHKFQRNAVHGPSASEQQSSFKLW